MSKFGLGVLMEALKESESAEAEELAEMNLLEEVASDEVKRLVTGEESTDDVENDMNGNGMSDKDKKRINDFLDSIPPAKSAVEYDEEEVEKVLGTIESYMELDH